MAAPYDKDGYVPLETFAYEALAVAGTAVPLTATTHSPTTGGPAKCAIVQCELAQLRYRLDGTAPTATVGVLLEVGDELIIWGSMDIQSAQFIRTGSSGQLNVHYAR